MTLKEFVQPLQTLDWNNTEEVNDASTAVLNKLVSNPDVLRQALLTLPDCPELTVMCEHYDILDKLVLHNDETGFRVRAHLFLPGYFDRPHTHRWSYTALIGTGGYKHVLYGTGEELNDSTDARTLQPRMVRYEQAGSSYTLHHSMIHAVTAEPYTISWVVRGPAVKDRFVVSDRVTGKSWWQYGNQQEDPAEAAAKRMSPQHLQEVVGRILNSKAIGIT